LVKIEDSLNLSRLTSAWLDGLPPRVAEKILREMSEAASEALAHDWEFVARPHQLAPPGDWQTWLFLAGRGSGKTRAGIEWVRRKIKQGSKRVALIAPTTRDARFVLIEGESGILAHAWEGDVDDAGNHMGRPLFEPSLRRLTWANGAIATTFSAEEPDRLRGPQHDCVLADDDHCFQH
jgi:phage terminase large subunit-like protein